MVTMRVLLLCVLLLLVGVAPATAAVKYVDVAATGANDGSSWADAFTTIQAGVTACAVGDTVLIWPGTYTESVALGSTDDLWIIGNSGTASDVVWTPSGTTDSGNGNAIQYNTGDSLRVKDVKFLGGASHQGIWHGSGKMLRVIGCEFENLRVGVYNRNGNATSIEVYNSSFIADDTAEAAPTNGASWGVLGWDAALTIQGCTFDQAGVTGEGWNDCVGIQGNSAGTVIRGNTFIGDEGDQQPFFRPIFVNSDILVEDNTFIGGNDSSGEAQVQIGSGALAADYCSDVIIRNNTFSNFNARAIYFPKAAASTGDQMHFNVQIYGNKIYGDGGTAELGMYLMGVRWGSVFGNEVRGCSASDGAGIQLASPRHLTISGNKLYNNDNHIVIVANGSLTGPKQYGSFIVNNFMTGDGGDGALKIDNYNAGAVANDSLLTVSGNVFVDVTAVATWIDTSDATNTMTTLAQYQDASTGWPSESTLDFGNTLGSSGSISDFPSLGGSAAVIGVRGKGLIK